MPNSAKGSGVSGERIIPLLAHPHSHRPATAMPRPSFSESLADVPERTKAQQAHMIALWQKSRQRDAMTTASK